MEKYNITKFGEHYKCQIKSIRYIIELIDNYVIDDEIGYELKFYLRDRKNKIKYNKLNALSLSETLSLINSIGEFAMDYGTQNNLPFLVFKSPGKEIGDEKDFPNNIRTRFFIRWFSNYLSPEQVRIDDERVIIRLN